MKGKEFIMKSALVLGLLILISVISLAEVTPSLPVQGKLTDDDGNALTGDYNVLFELYTVATGGASVWDENHNADNNVAVSSGVFSVIFGDINSLRGIFDFDKNYYLGYKINGEQITGRTQIGSVPTSFIAEDVNASKVSIGTIAYARLPESDLDNRYNNTSDSNDVGRLHSDVIANPPWGSINDTNWQYPNWDVFDANMRSTYYPLGADANLVFGGAGWDNVTTLKTCKTHIDDASNPHTTTLQQAYDASPATQLSITDFFNLDFPAASGSGISLYLGADADFTVFDDEIGESYSAILHIEPYDSETYGAAFIESVAWLPSADNTYDFGGSSRRWKDGYFAGTLYGQSTVTIASGTGNIELAGNLQPLTTDNDSNIGTPALRFHNLYLAGHLSDGDTNLFVADLVGWEDGNATYVKQIDANLWYITQTDANAWYWKQPDLNSILQIPDFNDVWLSWRDANINFVPYQGANNDLNLGTNSLTTEGDVNANIFYSIGNYLCDSTICYLISDLNVVTEITAGSGTTEFFFYKEDAGLSDYNLMRETYTPGAQQTISRTFTASDQILASFITIDHNFTMIDNGIAEMHFHGKVSAGAKTTKLYFEVYQRTSDGTENLAYTSTLSNALTTSDTEYELHCPINTTDLNITDHLVVKIKSNLSGGGNNPVMSFYIEGDTASHLGVPQATITTHNLLQGIQGGTANARYHLTQAQHDNVADLNANFVRQVDGNIWYVNVNDSNDASRLDIISIADLNKQFYTQLDANNVFNKIRDSNNTGRLNYKVIADLNSAYCSQLDANSIFARLFTVNTFSLAQTFTSNIIANGHIIGDNDTNISGMNFIQADQNIITENANGKAWMSPDTNSVNVGSGVCIREVDGNAHFGFC